MKTPIPAQIITPRKKRSVRGLKCEKLKKKKEKEKQIRTSEKENEEKSLHRYLSASSEHAFYQEKASSIKSILAISIFARTALRTSSLSEPLPQTVTPIVPMRRSISRSRIVSMLAKNNKLAPGEGDS